MNVRSLRVLSSAVLISRTLVNEDANNAVFPDQALRPAARKDTGNEAGEVEVARARLPSKRDCVTLVFRLAR